MKMDLEVLRKYEQEGLITLRKHPSKNLLLANYSKECQYEGRWDDITLNCRGTVITASGRVVAKPFPKFFNIGERPETQLEKLPTYTEPVYQEKVDGWLGIVFRDPEDGKVECCTRGSWTSEGVPVMRKFLEERIDLADPTMFLDGFTYCFEIVSPETRIVLDYGGETKLVLLAIFLTDTGGNRGYEFVVDQAAWLKVEHAKHHRFKDVEKMQAYLKTAKGIEGFVVVYPTGLRVKAKAEDYVRLHRVVTGWTPKRIWECLKDGVDFERMLVGAPEEFRAEMHSIADGFRAAYKDILVWGQASALRASYCKTRAEAAAQIKKVRHPQVAFCLLDKRNPEELIWKMLKPKGDV